MTLFAPHGHPMGFIHFRQILEINPKMIEDLHLMNFKRHTFNHSTEIFDSANSKEPMYTLPVEFFRSQTRSNMFSPTRFTRARIPPLGRLRSTYEKLKMVELDDVRVLEVRNTCHFA